MSNEHPAIDDPELGILARATTELTDGSVLTHDWYGGTITVDGSELELMLEGTAPNDIASLLPPMRATIAELATLRRSASDAVVTTFSNGEPEPYELEEAASDLFLETIEAAADGTIILHLIDSCGTHFPDGYWPAVRLGPDGGVEQVTVES